MSSREFAEWMAYEQVTGPLGPERGDIQMAVLASLIHNAFAKKSKKPKDFLLEWDPRPQSWEEGLFVLDSVLKRAGGDTDGDSR